MRVGGVSSRRHAGLWPGRPRANDRVHGDCVPQTAVHRTGWCPRASSPSETWATSHADASIPEDFRRAAVGPCPFAVVCRRSPSIRRVAFDIHFRRADFRPPPAGIDGVTTGLIPMQMSQKSALQGWMCTRSPHNERRTAHGGHDARIHARAAQDQCGPRAGPHGCQLATTQPAAT